MKLVEGTPLYHGSYTAIERIDLERCARGKDFGQGFYLTSDVDQAIRFLPSSLRKAQMQRLVSTDQKCGYVTSFRFHYPKDPLSIFVFEDADESWLKFVAVNRRPELAGVLGDMLESAPSEADIVIGKVANDATNPTITAYLNGILGPIDDKEVIDLTVKRLLPHKLTDQLCFLTQDAINCLDRVKVVEHEL